MDNLNPSEISEIIKGRIDSLETSTSESNEGTIVFLSDGIARVHGLSDAMYGELIEFDGGVSGMALNLERDSVGVVIFGDYKQLAEGGVAKCTGKILEVPVGSELVGRVVDALGNPIDGKGPIKTKLTSPVEKVAPGVMTRKPVDEPVQIGLKAVDSMVPIGRGQRELIIGDRQTGKTAIALDAIINQKGTGVTCVYVAVGQKQSSIAAVVRKLEEYGAMEHTMWLLPRLQILHQCNFSHPIQVALWENISGTKVKTLLLFMTISPSRLLHIVRYRFCSEGRQEEKPILGIFFTFTQDFLKEAVGLMKIMFKNKLKEKLKAKQDL